MAPPPSQGPKAGSQHILHLMVKGESGATTPSRPPIPRSPSSTAAAVAAAALSPAPADQPRASSHQEASTSTTAEPAAAAPLPSSYFDALEASLGPALATDPALQAHYRSLVTYVCYHASIASMAAANHQAAAAGVMGGPAAGLPLPPGLIPFQSMAPPINRRRRDRAGNRRLQQGQQQAEEEGAGAGARVHVFRIRLNLTHIWRIFLAGLLLYGQVGVVVTPCYLRIIGVVAYLAALSRFRPSPLGGLLRSSAPSSPSTCSTWAFSARYATGRSRRCGRQAIGSGTCRRARGILPCPVLPCDAVSSLPRPCDAVSSLPWPCDALRLATVSVGSDLLLPCTPQAMLVAFLASLVPGWPLDHEERAAQEAARAAEEVLMRQMEQQMEVGHGCGCAVGVKGLLADRDQLLSECSKPKGGRRRSSSGAGQTRRPGGPRRSTGPKIFRPPRRRATMRTTWAGQWRGTPTRTSVCQDWRFVCDDGC